MAVSGHIFADAQLAVESISPKNTQQSENFFEAIAQKNSRVFARLIKSKSIMSVRNQYQQTPLIYMVSKGYLDVFDLVLNSRYVEINAVDRYGKTALDYASELYAGKDMSQKQLNARRVVCNKLIAKKAKTSSVKYSEAIRNIVYPEVSLNRDVYGYGIKTLHMGPVLWSMIDSEQYNKSYKMAAQELEKELAVRDAAPILVSKKDIDNLRDLVASFSENNLVSTASNNVAQIVALINQYGQLSLRDKINFYDQKTVWERFLDPGNNRLASDFLEANLSPLNPGLDKVVKRAQLLF